MTLTGKVKSSDVSEIKMSLIALMTACVYYFFGSSSSSHSKDQTIAGQMNASKSPTKIDVANIEQVTNVDELDSEKRPPIGFKRPPV